MIWGIGVVCLGAGLITGVGFGWLILRDNARVTRENAWRNQFDNWPKIFA